MRPGEFFDDDHGFESGIDSQAASVADAVVKRCFKRGEPLVEQGKKYNALTIGKEGWIR